MDVIFLGTGTSQGIPVIGSKHPVCLSSNPKDKRLRVSVLISWNNYSVVIDCGPDFRQQMLRAKCSKIDALLFTHEHSDHTAGLDDIRPFYFKQGDIAVYAHKRVFDSLKQRFVYIFKKENKYPGVPNIIEFEIDKQHSFKLCGMEVIPIEGLHNNLPVLGYRFNDFAYLTDIKTMEAIEREKLKGLKVLVINALREKEHESHFSLNEALEFINTIKPEKAYLTHVSHLMGFHDEVQKQLPPHVFLAYDNLKINIDD